MRFPRDLESSAFKCENGEYAWRRQEARRAVEALAEAGLAVLGGEVWLIHKNQIVAVLPQRIGSPSVYHWESQRAPSETWNAFVRRSQTEALAAINDLPGDEDVVIPPGAELYYNLTWISEQQYSSSQ